MKVILGILILALLHLCNSSGNGSSPNGLTQRNPPPRQAMTSYDKLVTFHAGNAIASGSVAMKEFYNAATACKQGDYDRL